MKSSPKKILFHLPMFPIVALWQAEVKDGLGAILIMAAAIGIQIEIGTEIDEKARNSIPIAIAISISTVQMCHN
jgi:hypothetical protein